VEETNRALSFFYGLQFSTIIVVQSWVESDLGLSFDDTNPHPNFPNHPVDRAATEEKPKIVYLT
jgi:hypothetical protein